MTDAATIAGTGFLSANFLGVLTNRKFSAEDILTPPTVTTRPTQLIASINNDVQRPDASDRINLLYQSILIAAINDKVHCDILVNFWQLQSKTKFTAIS